MHTEFKIQEIFPSTLADLIKKLMLCTPLLIGFANLSGNISCILNSGCIINPASILFKSIAGRYRPVSYPDGPITARFRFIKNNLNSLDCFYFIHMSLTLSLPQAIIIGFCKQHRSRWDGSYEPSHLDLRCFTFSLSTLCINFFSSDCLLRKKSRRQMSAEIWHQKELTGMNVRSLEKNKKKLPVCFPVCKAILNKDRL